MQFIKIFKTIYRFFFQNTGEYLRKELSDYDSILDLGCGWDSIVQHCDAPLKVGVELFAPYIEESKKKGIHNQYIKEDITKVDFKPKSFDAVIMIDALEHLTKSDGYKLLKKIENWTKKKIVIFTPNGFVENDPVHDNYLQEHRSGWSVQDFEEMGFKVKGCNGWKKLRGKAAVLKYKPTFLWKIISDFTQKIVYYYPKLAWHLSAVKEIKSK